jgi:hypothetical protein
VLPRGAYLPFGAGARQCIGGAFATLEATLMLATLLARVQVDLAPGPPLRPVPRITLTAGAGLSAVARVRTAPALPAPRTPTYARRVRPVDSRPRAEHPVGRVLGSSSG